MRKIICIALVLLLLAGMTGCANALSLEELALRVNAAIGNTVTCPKCDGTGKGNGNGNGACDGSKNGNKNEGCNCMNSVKMTALVTAVGEVLEVEVIEAEYGNSGTFWLVTDGETKVCGGEGNSLTLGDIKVGDKIEITYSGQVMLSYPPQVYARCIKILK